MEEVHKPDNHNSEDGREHRAGKYDKHKDKTIHLTTKNNGAKNSHTKEQSSGQNIENTCLANTKDTGTKDTKE